MNRRLLIFVVVFLIVGVAGLSYTYSITPTYIATAKIQADPGANSDKPQENAAFVANEAQALMSNDLLESVLATLRQKPPIASRFRSVQQLHEVLRATPAAGTNVIELQARGGEPEHLAQLLEVWAAAYLESRGARRTVDRDASVDETRQGVQSMEARVVRKRRELDEFRRRHSIVSPERDQNEVAAEIKSLTGALNEARNKATDAESRLSTAKASVAVGQPVYRAQEKATLSQLEQRLSDLRQRLKELDLKFTPDYLAIEPSVKAMHANIRLLEQQIEETRRGSQQAMLNEVTQDVITARKNVERMEAQFGERRKEALNFTSRFAEHNAQTTELAQLEAQLGLTKQRLALLERTERTREPKYELLGRPAVPEKPVHPNYVRYAGYSAGAALLAALLAVVMVEFLIPRPKPQMPAYPQPIIQIAYPTLGGDTGGERLRLSGGSTALLTSPHTPQPVLAAPRRELTVPEVHALWNAAAGDGRLVVAALFAGLTLPELAELQWEQVDLEAGCLNLPNSTHPVRPLTSPLAQELQARAPRPGTGAVAATSAGEALSTADFAGLLAAAAHDAGLEEAETIDGDTLRHTYISFLVRQGARLSELDRIVGRLPPASFLHYRSLSPSGPGLPLTAVNCVFPAFRAA